MMYPGRFSDRVVTPVLVISFLFASSRPGAAAGERNRSPQAYLTFGTAFLQHHCWSDARYYLKLAAQKAPAWSAPHDGLGDLAFLTGDVTAARREYESALALNAGDHIAARHLRETMSPEERNAYLRTLREEATAEPDNADARARLAEEALLAGRLEDAAAAAQSLQRLSGGDGRASSVLGRIALLKGRLNEAQQSLLLAVGKDSRDDEALAALGEIAYQQNETSDALLWYRRAVAAAPDVAEWHERLAAALDSTNDHRGAGDERIAADRARAEWKCPATMPGPG